MGWWGMLRAGGRGVIASQGAPSLSGASQTHPTKMTLCKMFPARSAFYLKAEEPVLEGDGVRDGAKERTERGMEKYFKYCF